METKIRKLLEAHNLTFVSVMYYPDGTTVFLHWNDGDGFDTCASGGSTTFDAAFAKALIEVQTRRDQLGEVA